MRAGLALGQPLGPGPPPPRCARLLPGSPACCMTLRELVMVRRRVLRRVSPVWRSWLVDVQAAQHETERITGCGRSRWCCHPAGGTGRCSMRIWPWCRSPMGSCGRCSSAATGGVDDEELCALDRVVPALVRPDGPDLAGGRRAARVVHDLACARGASCFPEMVPPHRGWCWPGPGARRPGERAGSTAC